MQFFVSSKVSMPYWFATFSQIASR